METRIKLVLLIILYTISVILAYALNWTFGDPESLDWTFLIEALPEVLVCIVFGYLAENFKQLFSFLVVIVIIDTVFTATSLYFDPNQFAVTIELYGGSLAVFWVAAIIMFLVFSSFLLALGFIVSRMIRVIRPKAMPVDVE